MSLAATRKLAFWGCIIGSLLLSTRRWIAEAMPSSGLGVFGFDDLFLDGWAAAPFLAVGIVGVVRLVKGG